jgi:hypothetical protein
MQAENSVFAENREQYRFKILFLPYLSYLMGIMILMIFWSQIMSLPSSGVDSSSRYGFMIFLLGTLVQVLIFPPLFVLWFTRQFNIMLTAEGVYLHTSIPDRQYIKWQEITSIKSSQSN